MKCITFAVCRDFLPGHHTLPGIFVERGDPVAREGIEVDIDELAVTLGSGKRVRVNSRAFASVANTGVIRQEGRTLTILRAGVTIGDDGDLELTPERPGDTGALVLLDVGHGFGADSVSFEAEARNVVGRGFVNFGLLPAHDEEKLLAMLKPEDKVTAVRSSRRFILFGEKRVHERLDIIFRSGVIFTHRHPG